MFEHDESLRADVSRHEYYRTVDTCESATINMEPKE
jgi:hypothetical protein